MFYGRERDGIDGAHDLGSEHSDSSLRSIRLLIWLYFWLLLWEGALRKWVFPSWSTPLLLVRDPVLLLAYTLALAKGIFPFNRFGLVAILLAALSLGASL